MKKFNYLIIAIAMLACMAGCRDGKTDKAAESAEPQGWTKIAPEELVMNPVNDFANRWMALSMGKGEDMNAMTIAWGSIGNLWGKPVVIVYVSKDRFSKHIMDDSDYFTVTRFPDERKYKDQLVYIGSHSKKDDPDKVASAGMVTELTDLGNTIFSEGDLAIECRKIYADEFNGDLMPDDLREEVYSGMGMSSFYIGEIIGVWQKGSTPAAEQ